MNARLATGAGSGAAREIRWRCSGLQPGSQQGRRVPQSSSQTPTKRRFHLVLTHSTSRFSACRQPGRLAPTAEASRTGPVAVAAAASDSAEIPKPAFFEGLERPIGAPGSEWHPLLALAIFALGFFNHLTFNSFTLFKAFAIFQIVNSAVAILFNDDRYDKISSVVAPAVLAIWVMQPSLDPGDVTLGILGTYLCHELKVVPFWPMVLSLFAALYLGNGNEWITVAYCLLSVTGLVKAREADPELKEHKANLLTFPVLAVSAFVAWKGIIPLWTTSLGLGEVARSSYGLLHRLLRKRT